MSVRKRTWTTAKGIAKEAWVVDYTDQQGDRRLKTFSKKKDADAFRATATVEISEGTHVAESASATVKKAGELWVASSEALARERSTLVEYRSHLQRHIVPFIGGIKLSELNLPTVRAFKDDLRKEGRSPAMIRKILVSLGSILSDAQERGLVVRNVVRDMRTRRPKNSERNAEKRQKGKLKVGVDIATPDEIRSIIHAVTGRWRPLILTAIFTGLRASELRGLQWEDVDLGKREIHVRQRADKYNVIDRPKSYSSERTVPVPVPVANALKEWKLACPKGELGLVFPNGSGNIENLGNIVKRGLQPAQVAAGVTVDGKAKYTGMHALRHFYASWCINRPADGGLGLPPKVVQERLGHSTITMTMDVYGHLFPRGDDTEELAAAAQSLMVGS